jgi:TatD DNase family protein
MLIDTHAHLDFPNYDKDRDIVIRRAFDEGLSAIVTVGFDLNSSKKAIDITETYENIYAIIGVHPHEAKMVTKATLDEIKKLSQNKKVVGIGETGLDFYRNLSPKDRQFRVFSDFLHLSGETGIPVVIHDRDANREVIETLKSHEGSFTPGIIHCFSGDWNHAKTCMDMGFFISISGVVTFPKARTLHEVVKKLPWDKILFETDAPFLTPVPYRGKRNEPSYVKYTATECAKLRGEDPEELMDAAARNSMKIFGIADL